MTGRTPELMEIEGKSFIEMNEEDAERLHISNGEKVRVSSRRGSIETTARVGTKTSPGESWMPFHFPDGNRRVHVGHVVGQSLPGDVGQSPGQLFHCGVRVVVHGLWAEHIGAPPFVITEKKQNIGTGDKE